MLGFENKPVADLHRSFESVRDAFSSKYKCGEVGVHAAQLCFSCIRSLRWAAAESDSGIRGVRL